MSRQLPWPWERLPVALARYRSEGDSWTLARCTPRYRAVLERADAPLGELAGVEGESLSELTERAGREEVSVELDPSHVAHPVRRRLVLRYDGDDLWAALLPAVDLETKLLETQRLESLGLLAGGIAHDFNNLLTSILGAATVARRTRADPEALDEALGQIEQSCMNAAELCRQLLAYAGRGQVVHEPLDLAAVILETHELLATTVSNDVDFAFDLPPTLPSISADRSQLQQVVMNLLLNGAEATEGGGHVEVSARSLRCSEVDWASAELVPEPAEGVLVELTVRDDGRGMDAATSQQIFEPFFTTKFTGRGLGLAATRGILVHQGGGLKLESEPGRGTVFRLYFRATTEERRSSSAPPRPSSSGPLRILLVDDEEAVRDAAGSMLGVLGHEVTTAPDGAAALALHAAADPPFDLVVLDLTMPGMDGATALRQLRQRSDLLPVILMSGYSEADVDAHVAHPATAFLQKPFRFGDVERALQEALAPDAD